MLLCVKEIQCERRRLSELSKPILGKRQDDEQMDKIQTESVTIESSPSVKLARSGEGKKESVTFQDT